MADRIDGGALLKLDVEGRDVAQVLS